MRHESQRPRTSQEELHGLEVTTNPEEILKSPKIDAVAIVAPVWTHYKLAKSALENGKHVFVEKPFTSSSEQAEELIELAARWATRITAIPCVSTWVCSSMTSA